jgi:putative membrane protein
MTVPEPNAEAETQDASRRTWLALERTQLAWWRTGLTALAVGIGIGRVVPELQESDTQWPFVLVGVAFAVYGIALIVYGTARSRQVDAALGRGFYQPPRHWASPAIAAAGAVLGLLTAALIVIS